MNTKEFSEAMGELDNRYVEEAVRYKRAVRPRWAAVGAIAACLCLVICIAAAPYLTESAGNTDAGAGDDVEPGGTLSDGIDSVTASLAVYPATEGIEDVADAAVDSISEGDAYEFDTLGEYLPTSLPEGYQFDAANLYETTMKDGTRYYMLRVQYATGSGTAQGNAEEELAADPNDSDKSFVVFVMNYEPATEKQIYTAADITEGLLEALDGGTFHISYGDIYVGISPDTATSDDILAAVSSIK
ncbi:MAG: hypothetical protein LUF28_05640 [Clostridiales bacterium]|nr:hypothetical protein [Clostridiales bacterium]